MRLRTLLLAAWALARLASAQPAAPPGWDSYQVFMWSTGSPANFQTWIDRLREIGTTGEECTSCSPQLYTGRGFGYYVENMVSELGFLNSRSSLYSADWNGYFNCDSNGKNCNISATAA